MKTTRVLGRDFIKAIENDTLIEQNLVPGGYWIEHAVFHSLVCFTSIITGAKFLAEKSMIPGYLQLSEFITTDCIQLTGHMRFVNCNPQRVRTERDTHQEEDGIVWVGGAPDDGRIAELWQWNAESDPFFYPKAFNAEGGSMQRLKDVLGGKSLSTSMELSEPSHADWLLEYANFTPICANDTDGDGDCQHCSKSGGCPLAG